MNNRKAQSILKCFRTLFGPLFIAAFIGILFLFSFPRTTQAATSSTLNFQAKLMAGTGAIVPDGNYNVEFKLYNALTSSGSSQGSCTGDSACLWTETRTSTNVVRVVNGYLTVNLGSVTSFPSTINWDQNLYLTMNIGGTSGSPTWDGEMSPRLQLTAVPYAFRAGQLATLNGANAATLSFTAPTGSDAILLPDASGTVCLQAASSCGFAPGTSGSYIQNQTTVQTANAFIQSASSSNITEVLQGASGQSVDIFEVKSSTPATFLSVSSVGKTTLQSSTVNAAVLTLNNSDGTTGTEFRTGGSGLNDIFIGTSSGSSTTTGDKNTAVGTQALKTNADGVNNSAFGYFSLNSNTSGGKNTAVGYYSLQSNQTGNNNTAVGYYAFQGNTGGNNTALGYYAGYQDPTTGTFQSGTTLSNSTAIGYGSQVQASNTLTLGGQASNAVKVGIGTTIPSNTLSVSPVQYNTGTASQTGTTVSGTSTVWTSAMVGDELIFANGVKETVTGFTNSTTLTASVSQSVTLQAYRLHYVGFQVTSGGLVGIGNAAPVYQLDVTGDINSTTALRIAGTSVCDTSGTTGCIAKSGSGFYIHNQTTVQAANLYVQAATSGTVAAILQGNASGTADVLDIQNGSGAVLGSISSAGAVLLQNSTDSTTALNLMTSTGGTNETVLRVDTVSERVAIGVIAGTPSAKLNIATASTVGLRVFESGSFDAFELANATADIFDVSQTGTILQKTTTNSASAFQIQTSGGGAAAFDVDTSNSRVGIGVSAPSRTLDVATSSSSVNTLPILVEQAGTGDTGLELKLATQSYYVGADATDGNFKVSSNTATGSATVIGYNTAGTSTDTNDQNSMNATKFTAGASGTISQLNAYIATVDASPNNKAQMAIYSDSSGSPGTLLASSASVALTANTTNAFVIPSVAITSGTVYWLVYNTNSSSNSKNNFKLLAAGGTNQSKFVAQTYGTWPSSWSGGSFGNTQSSFYGSISSTSPTDNFSTSLFAIGSSGRALFQNSTDSSNAFQVQKADATQLFNVDTGSEIITLGPAAGDATGTVLVLGNKTGSSTDPTGTAGAMYYNVTLNAFRCYENGAWYNCLTHHIVTLGADVTNNNVTANTIADVTGLSFAVTSGTTYHFHASIDYTAATTGTGSRWSVNGPTTTLLGFTSSYSLTTVAQSINFLNAYDTPATSNVGSALTTGNTAIIEGMIKPSANGTLIVRFASGTSSSAIVAKAGSTIEWW